MCVGGGGGGTKRGQRERDHDRGKKRADHSNGAGREFHREGSLHTRSASAKAADIGCAQFFPSPTLRVLRGCSRRAPRSNDFYSSHQNLKRGDNGEPPPSARRSRSEKASKLQRWRACIPRPVSDKVVGSHA